MQLLVSFNFCIDQMRCDREECGHECSTQHVVLENKILMGHECTSLQQTDEGILVGASFNNGGGGVQERVSQQLFFSEKHNA
jgi:hypothetical protein